MTVLHRFDWADIGYSGLVIRLDSGLAVWRVFEVVEASINGTPPQLYARDEVYGNGEPGPLMDADHVVEVTVKADGCANWSWLDWCATHTCDGVEGAEKLATMIRRVVDTTADILHPNWIRS